MFIDGIKNWYQKKYTNNEPVVFVALMLLFYLIITLLGNYIAPILAAVVIAYLLDTLIETLRRVTKIKRVILVYIVFMLFVFVLFSVIFVLLPVIFNQTLSFVKEMSDTIPTLKHGLEELSVKFPLLLSAKRIDLIMDWFDSVDWNSISSTIGSYLLKYSVATLPVLFSACVYLFLVPLMVFYFLKDKEETIAWFKSFLPEQNGALYYVWNDLKPKLGDYVRGKAIEFIVVSVLTYFGFAFFHLNYALLLAFAVGLSVVIPYIGMVIVTIPVVMVGMLQYGFNMTFVWMLLVYFIIQIIDGNLFVPILFSEVLNMHPIGVVSSILIFGGIWGLWGIFFAIPLGLLFMSGVNMFRNHHQRKRIINSDLC